MASLPYFSNWGPQSWRPAERCGAAGGLRECQVVARSGRHAVGARPSGSSSHLPGNAHRRDRGVFGLARRAPPIAARKQTRCWPRRRRGAAWRRSGGARGGQAEGGLFPVSHSTPATMVARSRRESGFLSQRDNRKRQTQKAGIKKGRAAEREMVGNLRHPSPVGTTPAGSTMRITVRSGARVRWRTPRGTTKPCCGSSSTVRPSRSTSSRPSTT